ACPYRKQGRGGGSHQGAGWKIGHPSCAPPIRQHAQVLIVFKDGVALAVRKGLASLVICGT
ncbi:MAG: hypothetical protein AAFY56_16995, partial [Pseudomonadota bacterium]